MTRDNLVVAIDVGTSGTRTAVFNAETGTLLAQAHQEYGSFFPHPTWVEQKALDWWKTACNTSLQTLKILGKQTRNIVAVSVTNQRETIVPVDEKGEPLHNAIVWQDRRSIPQCTAIREKIGDKALYLETGLTIDPYFSAPKILWLQEHHRKIFDATYKFLLVHDFIIHRLSNEFATDYSNASRTMLFSITQQKWSNKICNQLDIPKEKLPTTHPSTTPIGTITKAASKETGLPEDIPIIAGGGDQQCGAVGVGVVQPGRVKATMGTGTFILAHEDHPRFDEKRRLLCSCHAMPGKWIIEASIFTSGIIYRWFRDQFSQEEKELAKVLHTDAYDLLNTQAANSPAGSRGILMLPYFVGAGAPHWNPAARGVLLGLALGHKRDDIIRSIMESTAFEVRRNLNVMRSQGITVKELRLTGGATRSSIWNQIQADINQLIVQRSLIEEATAVGAAILASVGCGIHKDVVVAANTMVSMGEEYQPTASHKNLYDKLFTIQTDAYNALEKAKVFARLKALDQ